MKYRRELALLGGAVAFALLLAEVGLRIHYHRSYSGGLEELRHSAPPRPGKSVFLGQILTIEDGPMVYRLLPDLDVRFRGVPLRTNSRGWREDELPVTKEPGTVRVVGIGDSVMFGWGVREPWRYMDRLEAELNEAHPAKRWQSVTLAVPGYNLVMEVEALARSGLEYSPDLVVVGYSMNDFCLPNFVVPRRSVWSPEPFLALYLARGRDVAPRLVERLDVLLAPSRGPEAAAAKPRGPEFFATYCSEDNVPKSLRALVGTGSFLAALERLIAIGRDRGIPVVFLHHGIGQGFVPLGEPDETTTPEVARTLAAVRELSGLIVADLTPGFHRMLARGVEPRDLVLSDTDPHPSVQGHRHIARLLRRFLEKEGIVRDLMAEGPPASSNGSVEGPALSDEGG